jgi:leader peptidase (prepilin peptidase) / N-methyltransferase
LSSEAFIEFTLSAYLVLVALLCGSFINLASDRLPRNESLIRPRSHCRACGRQLNLIDLVPVVGYLVRGGRCASCRTAIGSSSPAVEAVCGLLMLASLVFLGVAVGALVGFAAVLLLGLAAVSLAWHAREGVVRRVLGQTDEGGVPIGRVAEPGLLPNADRDT